MARLTDEEFRAWCQHERDETACCEPCLDDTLAIGLDVQASLSNWEMNPGYRQGAVIG